MSHCDEALRAELRMWPFWIPTGRLQKFSRKTNSKHEPYLHVIKTKVSDRFSDGNHGYLLTSLVEEGGGVLKKILYGEAPPHGPNPYHF